MQVILEYVKARLSERISNDEILLRETSSYDDLKILKRFIELETASWSFIYKNDPKMIALQTAIYVNNNGVKGITIKDDILKQLKPYSEVMLGCATVQPCGFIASIYVNDYNKKTSSTIKALVMSNDYVSISLTRLPNNKEVYDLLQILQGDLKQLQEFINKVKRDYNYILEGL